jgi:hypothetical protein
VKTLSLKLLLLVAIIGLTMLFLSKVNVGPIYYGG